MSFGEPSPRHNECSQNVVNLFYWMLTRCFRYCTQGRKGGQPSMPLRKAPRPSPRGTVSLAQQINRYSAPFSSFFTSSSLAPKLPSSTSNPAGSSLSASQHVASGASATRPPSVGNDTTPVSGEPGSHSDPDRLVGLELIKTFPGMGNFRGTIVSFDPPYYKVGLRAVFGRQAFFPSLALMQPPLHTSLF